MWKVFLVEEGEERNLNEIEVNNIISEVGNSSQIIPFNMNFNFKSNLKSDCFKSLYDCNFKDVSYVFRLDVNKILVFFVDGEIPKCLDTLLSCGCFLTLTTLEYGLIFNDNDLYFKNVLVADSYSNIQDCFENISVYDKTITVFNESIFRFISNTSKDYLSKSKLSNYLEVSHLRGLYRNLDLLELNNFIRNHLKECEEKIEHYKHSFGDDSSGILKFEKNLIKLYNLEFNKSFNNCKEILEFHKFLVSEQDVNVLKIVDALTAILEFHKYKKISIGKFIPRLVYRDNFLYFIEFAEHLNLISKFMKCDKNQYYVSVDFNEYMKSSISGITDNEEITKVLSEKLNYLSLSLAGLFGETTEVNVIGLANSVFYFNVSNNSFESLYFANMILDLFKDEISPSGIKFKVSRNLSSVLPFGDSQVVDGAYVIDNRKDISGNKVKDVVDDFYKESNPKVLRKSSVFAQQVGK